MRLEDNRVPLEVQRRRALDDLGRRVGALRSQLITDIAGQEATYQQKAADCRAYLAADTPSLADHPWVAAEAKTEGMAPADAARRVIDTQARTDMQNVAIEQARRTLQTAIRNASDSAGIAAASYASRQALAGNDTLLVPETVTQTIRIAIMGPSAEVEM